MSDYARILHAYKLRLTNLAQSNRSLKLARLSVRRDIDLLDLGFVGDDTAEDILARIIAGKSVTLLGAPDPRLDKANRLDRRLGNIFRELALIEEESGAYDLHVGYPFCEGRFLDGTIVRAPVLLFPVRLERNLSGYPRWSLRPLKEEGIQLNRTFFMAWELYQQMRFPATFWDTEIPYNKDWGLWMADFYELLKQVGMAVNFNSELFFKQLQPFPDLLKATLDAFPAGRLTFRPQAVLGMFPQSDSALHDDYETLETTPSAWPLSRIFAPAPLASTPQTPREEHRYLVTEVDQSQEEALMAAHSGASLVVHGPPGTGKSQVIVNLIAHALAHRKTVLVVSHKRAALEVVWRRLSALELGQFALQVYDIRHDRRTVFDTLRTTIEDLEKYKHDIIAYEDNSRELAYLRACREADQSAVYFDELHHALSHRQPSGFSAHELYERLIVLGENIPSQPLATEENIPPQPSLQREGVKEVIEKQLFISKEAALAITAEHIPALRQAIESLSDYRELLEPSHWWADRRSQAHFTPDQHQQLVAKLAQLPAEIAQLATLSAPIQADLGEKLFDLTYLGMADHVFSQMLNKAPDPDDWAGMALLAKDRTKMSTHYNWVSKMNDLVIKLRNYHFANSQFIVNSSKTANEYKIWQSKKDDWFPWLSGEWRAARNSLRAVLAAANLPDSDAQLPVIGQALEDVKRLVKLAADVAAKPAFADFPQHSSPSEMAAWLAVRSRWLDSWTFWQSQVLPLVPAKDSFNPSRLASEALPFLKHILHTLSHWRMALRDWRDQWLPFLHENQLARLQQAIIAEDSPTLLAEITPTYRRDFRDLQALDRLRETLPAPFAALVADLSQQNAWQQPDFLADCVEQAVLIHHIGRLEQLFPILGDVSTRGFERKRLAFAENLATARSHAAFLVQRRVKEHLLDEVAYNRLGNPVTYRKLLHEVSKKRQLWTLRRLFAETWHDGLDRLAPVWLTTPEVASAIFPLQPGLFDLVLVDEGSQCFVERALPALLRGKQHIVAGDDKQLQPSSLYTVRYEDDEAEAELSGGSQLALEVESVLDLARRTLPEFRLLWHYRSAHEALIRFSNAHFYENRLLMVPGAHPPAVPPLKWIQAEGVWENQTNPQEAQLVVDEVLHWLAQPEPPGMGVVTFNQPQQALIADLLDEALLALQTAGDPRWERLSALLSPTAAEPLFVKNIENVQGDERDIILFSIGYAPNRMGSFSAQFGLLNRSGGENRLNVAITRARMQVCVVCSFVPSALSVDDAKHPGPGLLRAWLQYVRDWTLQGEAPHTARETLRPVLAKQAQTLRKAGFSLQMPLGTTRYRADIGAVKAGEAIAIEAEGGGYFGGRSAREREVYRPALLARRGWAYRRIWLRELWMGDSKFS